MKKLVVIVFTSILVLLVLSCGMETNQATNVNSYQFDFDRVELYSALHTEIIELVLDSQKIKELIITNRQSGTLSNEDYYVIVNELIDVFISQGFDENLIMSTFDVVTSNVKYFVLFETENPNEYILNFEEVQLLRKDEIFSDIYGNVGILLQEDIEAMNLIFQQATLILMEEMQSPNYNAQDSINSYLSNIEEISNISYKTSEGLEIAEHILGFSISSTEILFTRFNNRAPSYGYVISDGFGAGIGNWWGGMIASLTYDITWNILNP